MPALIGYPRLKLFLLLLLSASPAFCFSCFLLLLLSASPAFRLTLLVLAFLILRIGLASTIPLSIDEAYAVVVSRSHSLSYFDHPPLGFALARFMADITGSECRLVAQFQESLHRIEWEVVFVDDDSKDGTIAAVRDIAARLRSVGVPLV